jgi:hypothetical protein
MSDFSSFVESQHALNIKMSESLGRIEESLRNTNQRLLGGDGQQGAIPYMSGEVKKVNERVQKLETWKTGTLKWVGGVVAVLSAEAALLGFYFNHVSGKVQEIQALLKH